MSNEPDEWDAAVRVRYSDDEEEMFEETELLTNYEDEIRVAVLDKRAAFLTMDALERQVVAAVVEGEMEVAAETAAALFLLQSDLPGWTDAYHEVSEEFEVEERIVRDAMEKVRAWTIATDHSARGWFE